MRFSASICLTALLAIGVQAQTGSQNASLPDCLRPCDTQAIDKANCTATDQYCHCVRSDTIIASITPCAQYNSTCAAPVADLQIFENLFASVCEKFNIKIPTNVSAVLGNASVTAGVPPVYTGAAGALIGRGKWVMTAWLVTFGTMLSTVVV